MLFPKIFKIKRFKKDQNGVAIIEFAIWGSVMFMVIFGIIEVSLVLLAQNVMESAVFNAARAGKVGTVFQNMTAAQSVRQTLEMRSNGLLDPDELMFTQTDLAPIGGVAPVRYRLEYDWPIFTPLIGQFIGQNGRVRLRAETILQREPTA